MSVPTNLSPVKHLQNVARETYNDLVREWFQDLGGADWNENTDTPRASIRVACTHKRSDSAIMTQLRIALFNLVKEREALAIAGLPLDEIQATRKYKPQIFCYFQEDQRDVEAGFSPVTGSISFRIMNNDNITPAAAANLARDIKAALALGGGFVWRKGRAMVTYNESDRGYGLQILCRDKAGGRDVVSKILSIQNHTPNWERANYKENEAPGEAFPTMPPRELIYGENRRLPRRRPVADVRFQYAVLHLWGLPNPVCLVDRAGVWPAPLERV